MDAITYPCCDLSWTMLVKGAPGLCAASIEDAWLSALDSMEIKHATIYHQSYALLWRLVSLTYTQMGCIKQ